MRRLVLLAGVFCACAARQAAPPANPATPVVHYDMEPIKIEAVPGPTGVQIEAFDAEELFERAGAALSAQKYDDAIRFYDKLLTSFPASSYARAGLYNRGLAQRDKKDWPAAIASFKAVAETYADHADSKDALFQLGACHAEQGNWPTSGEVFIRLLERKDLNADDRVEAMARRGFAEFNLKDLETAEKTFRTVLEFRKKIEGEERLATDFYLAFSQYHLAQITHERFRVQAIRLPESQMERDLEVKAGLLLQAQRSYIDTIKFGNAGWASAAGFQVGSLYEELYDAFVKAPVPAEVTGEARQVYQDELHKKIKVLLEKSVRWYRENLLMIERLGVNSDWAEKSKIAYAKLLKLLDPNAMPEPQLAPRGTPTPADAPKPPTPPDAPGRPNPPPTQGDDVKRQIL